MVDASTVRPNFNNCEQIHESELGNITQQSGEQYESVVMTETNECRMHTNQHDYGCESPFVLCLLVCDRVWVFWNMFQIHPSITYLYCLSCVGLQGF